MVNRPWDLLSSGTSAIPAAIALSGAGLKFLALEEDIAFVGVNAIDGTRQLGFPGAHQSVKTGDLPGVDLEGNIVQRVVGEMFDFKDRIRTIDLPRGVYCSNTVLPIIILISSDRSWISDTGFVSICLPSRMTVT